MKSCQDYLAELREKIHFAEDQLRSEKKNLYRAQELLAEEKDKWEAEVKKEELKLQENEDDLKFKKLKLENLRAEYDELLKKSTTTEKENENLKREIQKTKIIQQDKLNQFLLEQANLEKELKRVRELQKDVSLTNKWTKILQQKELQKEEEKCESVLSAEVKQLTEEFAKKIEAYEENLMEIDRTHLTSKKAKLAALLENLEVITAECKAAEKKNRELEAEIQLLSKK